MAKKKGNSSLTPLLIVAGLLGIGYLWVRHQIQFLQFGSASVPFQQIKNGALRLGIALPIINASSIGISMNRFSGYIKSPTGAILGTVALQKPVQVPKGTQGTAEFMAVISLSDAAQELFAIVTGGGKPDLSKYTVEGQAWVFGIPVPVKTSLL